MQEYKRVPKDDVRWKLIYLFIPLLVIVLASTFEWETGLFSGMLAILTLLACTILMFAVVLLAGKALDGFWPVLYYNGDSIRTKIKGKEITIRRNDIERIEAMNLSRPPRVKLTLRNGTKFTVIVHGSSLKPCVAKRTKTHSSRQWIGGQGRKLKETQP